MKTCSKCKIEKPEQDFSIRKDRPCGLMSSCKICQRKRSKAYHSSERGQFIRIQYQKSPRGKLSQKLGHAKHKLTERRKIYNLQYSKQYRESEHGRLIYQHHARRRQEIKKEIDASFTTHDATVIRDKFQHQCFNCGSKDRLQIDHHYPLSKGFGLSLSNAVLLCKKCNISKHNKLPEEFYPREKLEQLKCPLAICQS